MYLTRSEQKKKQEVVKEMNWSMLELKLIFNNKKQIKSGGFNLKNFIFIFLNLDRGRLVINYRF